MNDQYDDDRDWRDSEYGVPAGFEDWNDFNDYCDEFERGLDLE